MPNFDPNAFLRDLKELQTSFFDKSSAYTKVILGLGYGAFFTVWAGTKQHLSARQAIVSALLMLVSLLLYILFEIAQTMIMSYLAIELTRAISVPTSNAALSIQRYKDQSIKLTLPLLSVWKIVFPLTLVTGLGGASVLIYAFVTSLLHMK